MSINDPQWPAPTDSDASAASMPQPITHAKSLFVTPNAFRAPASGTVPTSAPAPYDRKLRWQHVALIALLTVIAMVAGIMFFVTKTPRVTPSPYEQGYTGSGTLTGTLVSSWANGVDVAWNLDEFSVYVGDYDAPSLLVEGTTLYVAAKSDSEGHAVVAAYDVSGAKPEKLWMKESSDTTVTKRSDTQTLASAGDSPTYNDVVIDKKTGAIAQAPWPDDVPMAAADDILATCSGMETYAGWKQESGSWRQQWESVTSRQGRDLALETPNKTRMMGSGEDASFLLSAEDGFAPQIINIHTGTVTTFGGDAPVKKFESRGFLVASGGHINVSDYDKADVYNMTGKLVETIDYERMWTVPTSDGPASSLDQLCSYLKDSKAPWATGTIEMTGSKRTTATLILSSDVMPRPAYDVKNMSISDSKPCLLSPFDVRASADGVALFISKAGSPSNQRVCFANTNTKEVHTSKDLNGAHSLMWAYDDLAIDMTKQGVVVFTPASV